MAEDTARPICAAVLAASGSQDKVAQAYGVPSKAMVPVGGEPVVRRVVAALKGARLVDEVTVIVAPGSPVGEMVADIASVAEARGPSILDTIGAAIAGCPEGDQILLATCDLPLLTSVAVDDFVSQALAAQAEMTYSIISKQLMEEAFPGGKRTYIPLRGGTVTGGNLFCVVPRFVIREQPRIAQAFGARKNPFALGMLLGFGFLLGLMMGRYRVEDVVRHAEKLLNCRLHVVQSGHPEIGFDIDKPSHVELANQALARLVEERRGRPQ